MTALEVDRGNALPLASIFFTLRSYAAAAAVDRPSPYPLSLVGSIKALLDSGIIAFLVCSSKTRKRLVFSVDRSFSRLSARGIVVSRELIKQIRIGPTQLLLKRQPLFILPFPSQIRVSFLSVPSSYMRPMYIHARTQTRNVYVFMHVHTRMHECHVSCDPLSFSFPRFLFLSRKALDDSYVII